MNIELIATDIDGTLIRKDHSISKLTKDTLKDYKNKGGKVVLATGRAYFSTKKIIEMLDYKGIIISYNGAKIIEVETGKVISHTPVEAEDTLEAIRISRKYGVHLNLYQNEEWYVEKRNSLESEEYTVLSGVEPIEKNFDTFQDYRMTKLLFIGKKEKLEEIEKELKNKEERNIHLTYSKTTFLEIMNKNVNKARGVEKVLNYFGISKEKTAAFGDERNDKEMLEFVKYGVAMGNANPELKKIAQYVTLTNEEDGIVEFLKKNLKL
jgi:hypothetical protein